MSRSLFQISTHIMTRPWVRGNDRSAKKTATRKVRHYKGDLDSRTAKVIKVRMNEYDRWPNFTPKTEKKLNAIKTLHTQRRKAARTKKQIQDGRIPG